MKEKDLNGRAAAVAITDEYDSKLKRLDMKRKLKLRAVVLLAKMASWLRVDGRREQVVQSTKRDPEPNDVSGDLKLRAAELFDGLTSELIAGLAAKDSDRSTAMMYLLRDLNRLSQDLIVELKGITSDEINDDFTRIRQIAMNRLAQAGWFDGQIVNQ